MDTVTRRERSRIMSLVRSKDTKPELLVRRLVHALGYRYRLHVRTLPGTPDLVFPSRRQIILVSGSFWNMQGCGRCRMPSSRRDYWIAKLIRNRARDQKSRRALRRLGWQVLNVWECQTNNVSSLSRRVSVFLRTK